MFKRKVSVAILQAQSDQIVDVFTKTIDDLSAVNKEANELTVEKTAEIQKLETEVEVLQEIQTKNQTVISKIQKIFE
jgi:hypothetical protein